MGSNANALRAGAAFVEFTLRDGKIRKGLAGLQKRFTAVGQRMRSLGKIGLGVGSGILGAFALPVKAASDLEETMNKFNVVFGENAGAVKAWGDDFADQIGRSQKQIAEFLGNSQDLFVPLGFEPGAATELSKQVTGLAFDLASFNNIADDDAIRDLHAALTGSGEVMKKYGVIVSEAAVKQELLNKGLDANSATEQQKVQARLAIIMRGTTAAQGDAIRSAGGFANQMKGLQGVLSDTAAAIGTAVLPMITSFVEKIRRTVVAIREWVSANPGLIQGIAIAGAVIAGIGAALFAAGTAFSVLSFAAAGLSTAIGVVGAVVGAILSPIGLVVVAIGGAVVAFATLTESGREMTANLMSWFGELGEIATTTFAAISAALASGDIGLAAEILWAGLKLAWLQGTAALRETWHNMTAGIAKVWYTVWAGMQVLASSVWGNLSRGWSHTAEFFTTVWETAVGNIKKAWNSTVAFIEATWQRIKGLFGADVSAELDRIHAELAVANGEIDRQNANSAAGRAAAGAAARESSRQLQAGTLDAIGADLAAKLNGADEGAKAKIAAAEKALADARAALTTKAGAAAAAAAATTAAAAEEKKKTGPAAAGMADATKGLSSMGTFSAAVAALSFGGGGVENEILKVNREQLEQQKLANRKKIELPRAT